MLKLIVIGALIGAALAARAANPVDTRPVVLRGLDPVLLLKGQEVKGKKTLAKAFGKFTYLFATAADRALFTQSPSSYAVQNNGACVHMNTMDGLPDLFLVYKGKIYLAGHSTCLAAVKQNPEPFVNAQAPAKSVAILVFPGVEIIDYTGPWEVFGGAGYRVFTVAAKPGPFKSAMGMTVTPDYTFADAPASDVLLLPGGGVAPDMPSTDPTIKWVKHRAMTTTHVMSVCNGAFWLANAGLLDGNEATTTAHWLATLRSNFPKITVRADRRFTDNGQILTTGGLTAGIDGALHLLEKRDGLETADAVALALEYNRKGNENFLPRRKQSP